jgi:hypothetical protein
VQNSEGKAKREVPLTAKHQSRAARRKQRPQGPSQGAALSGRRPARAKTVFKTPWRTRQRTELQEQRRGQAPKKKASRVGARVVKSQRLNTKSRLVVDYLWISPGGAAANILLRPGRCERQRIVQPDKGNAGVRGCKVRGSKQ